MSYLERPKKSGRHKSPTQKKAASVLGEFLVENVSYRIVPLDTRNSVPADTADSGDVLARFLLRGREFAVLEAACAAAPDEEEDVAARLTARELQIAVLVARGNPVKRVADTLRITDWTVREYLRRIYGKLHVHSQAAMVYRCASLLRRLDAAGDGGLG